MPKAEKITYHIFSWKGLQKRTGRSVKGKIAAETLEIAEHQLSLQGIDVETLKKIPEILASSQIKRISSKDISLFARQMATMINAGVPLVQSLEIFAGGIEHLRLQAVVFTLHKDVSEGSSFANALSRHPKQFNALICSLVRAGEVSGTLGVVLNQIANYLERVEVIKGRVKKAMFYPVIMLVAALSIATLLLVFIVPQFEQLFASFGKKLPAPTQAVLDLSLFIQDYGILLLIGIVLFIILMVQFYRRSEGFQRYIDGLKMRVFIFGPLIKQAIIARVTRTLAITLGAGIPLVDALDSVAQVSGNRVFMEAIYKSREKVISGEPLTVAFMELALMPNMVIQMVSVGEKTGELEAMLQKIAEYYDEQVTATVDGLSTLIEPIMLIILGSLIGTFVVTMYLPIFELGKVI